jgi:hypothetical protein
MRGTPSTPRLLLCVVALLIPAGASGQVTLEVQQSGGWATTLTVSQPQILNFRWQYSSGPPIASAYWQLAYSSDGSPVKQAVITPPSKPGEVASFSVAPTDVPSNAPPTYYVRVRSARGSSAWIPIQRLQRAGVATTTSTSTTSPISQLQPEQTRTGTTTETTRPRLEPQQPTTSTFTIPGGGGGTLAQPMTVLSAADTPLWARLTKIICEVETNDATPSDEVYAIVGIVALNRTNLSNSLVGVRATPIYEDFDTGDSRVPNLDLWGPASAPLPIKDTRDSYILVALMEHDDAFSMPFALQMVKAKLLTAVSALSPNLGYADIERKLNFAFQAAVSAGVGADWQGDLTSSDDWIDGQTLVFTPEELAAAQSGTVVKKPFVFAGEPGRGSVGRYRLHVQVGRTGTSTAAW